MTATNSDTPEWQVGVPRGTETQRLLLMDESGQIGFLGVDANPVHPYRKRMRLQLPPTQVCDKVLMDAMILLDSTDEIQIGISAGEHCIVSALVRARFRPIMRTRLGSLDCRQLPMLDFRLPYEVVLCSLLDAPLKEEELIDALHAAYRLQHTWSPMAEISHEMAKRLWLPQDEVSPEREWFAMRDGKIIGVASIRHRPNHPHPELGLVGSTDLASSYIVKPLLHHALNWARERLSYLHVEVDENCPQILAALEELSVE